MGEEEPQEEKRGEERRRVFVQIEGIVSSVLRQSNWGKRGA
tara:strand:+ start:262 stop:384 length:123 start_codon:yes stop_codon:yes gene_type:complete